MDGHAPPSFDPGDPRPRGDELPPSIDVGDALRPAVAGTSTGASLWLVGGGAAILGLVAFMWLSGQRHPAEDLGAANPRLAMAATTPITAPPPPPEIVAAEAASRQPVVADLPPPPPPILQPPPMPPPPPSSGVEASIAARRKAPALVVDLSHDQPAGAAATTVGPAGAGGGKLDSNAQNEQFAERIGTAELSPATQATMMRNPQSLLPQGTMIPGVLETALNSDLPGFVRAVVSRDVRSFDGSTVLIPRGSRVIGQYKSGVAMGQSRAFVIWSRVLRPDGASVQIASSGADDLGRAGMTGEVNRHFFQRFGGAVLLSVINAGAYALSDRPSAQVIIGSSQDAAGLASAALTPASIPPTIKVPQGSPIRIFVSRDLDFSTVGGSSE